MIFKNRTIFILILAHVVFLCFQMTVSASENLLANGSFEMGSWGWSPVLRLDSAIDEKSAFKGNRCLHLKEPFEYGNGWVFRKIQSQYFLVEAGGEYSFSFYAKTDSTRTPIWASLVSSYKDTKKSEPYRIKKRFTLTPDWKRYQVKGHLKEGGRNAYLVEFEITGNKGSIWLDAVGVTKGGDIKGEYKGKPIESAIYTGERGYYVKGDGVRFTVYVTIDSDRSENLSLRYSLIDYYGKKIGGWEKEIVTHPLMRNYTDELYWRSDKCGIFRLELDAISITGLRSDKSEAIFAVLPVFENSTSVDSPFGTHLQLVSEMASIARRLGIKWVRLHDMENFTNWFKTEPERGKFHWYDDRVTIAYNNGLNILGVIEKPPYWASSGKPQKEDRINAFMKYPPSNLKDFGEYVFTMVSHYRERIRFWEIWNEPYNKPFWSGTKAEFVSLMKTAYEAAKKADPDCVIVAPAGRWEFIRDIFELGAYNYLDVLSYHQYFANTRPWNSFSSETRMVKDLKTLMKKYGVEKPIWNTEGGLVSRSFYTNLIGGDTPRMRKFRDSSFYDYRRPAELIVKWYTNNLSVGVQKCFYYYMREDGIGYFDTRECYQSLLEYDRKPKPHAVALAVLADQIGNSPRFVRLLKRKIRGSSFLIHIFENGDKLVGVVWCEGESSLNKWVETGIQKRDISILDIMGNEILMNSDSDKLKFNLRGEPFYLRPKEGIGTAEFVNML